jgi:hypothetical protein
MKNCHSKIGSPYPIKRHRSLPPLSHSAGPRLCHAATMLRTEYSVLSTEYLITPHGGTQRKHSLQVLKTYACPWLDGQRGSVSCVIHLNGGLPLHSRSQAPAWERKSSKLCFVSIPTDLEPEIQQKVPTDEEHALKLWGSPQQGRAFWAPGMRRSEISSVVSCIGVEILLSRLPI